MSAIWYWMKKNALWLFGKHSWSKTTNTELAAMSIREGIVLTPEEVQALGKRIVHIPSPLLQKWTKEKIESITSEQLRAINLVQIQCLVTNQHFLDTMARKLVISFDQGKEFYKIAEVFQALSHTQSADRVIRFLVEAIQQLSSKPTREFLTVIAQTADKKQFSQVIKLLGMEKIVRYFQQDCQSGETVELAKSVKERELAHNSCLQKTESTLLQVQEWKKSTNIDAALFAIEKLGKKDESTGGVLDKVKEGLAFALHALSKSVTIPTAVHTKLKKIIKRQGKEAVSLWEREVSCWVDQLKSEQERLYQSMLTPQHFTNYWIEKRIPLEYAKKRGKKDEIEKLFIQSRSDAKFLEKITPELHDRIRLHAECGEFSIHFFNRMIAHKLSEPTEEFLLLEEIEKILALPGMEEVLDLFTLHHQLEMISNDLAKKVALRHAA